MGKFIGGAIGGFYSGAQQFLKGAGQVIGGVFTLDANAISAGFGNLASGALNAVTFGGFQLLVDWVTPEEQDFAARKQMARGADTPRSIMYGEGRAGGQLVIFESTGTDSQFMHMVVTFAPHEVQGIDEIYFNDDLAFDANGTPAPAFDGKVTLIKELGDQTTANSTIVSNIPSWTADHIGYGVAYIYVRLTYDKELFGRGLPSVSAVVRGKKLYNPATMTTEYTRNHALVVLDYLQSDLGFRATNDEIDMPSFISGAAICDQQMAAAVGTEPRYTVDGPVSLAGGLLDNLTALLRAGAAQVNYVQGKFTYVPGIYQAPAAGMEFDESDLVGGIQLVAGAPKSQLTNTAKGTYIDARQDYEPVQFPPISPADYVARDGEELTTEIPMPYASSPTLARRLAKIMVERERYGVTVSVTLKWRALPLTVGDRIKLSIARFGWSERIFRVETVNVSLSAGVAVTLREDAPSIWDWQEGEAIDVTPPPALNLPTITPIPAPAVTLQERVNTPNTQNQDRVTVLATATPPGDARYAYASFDYRLAGVEQWTPLGYSTTNQISFVVPASGDEYEVRARPVSQTGRVWDTETIESITVWNRATQGPPQPERTLIPAVYSLRLVNNEPGSVSNFKSGNAEFVWQARSQTESVDFTDDTLGADAGQFDPYFDDYRVRVFVGSALKFEDIVRQPKWVLTLEDNRRHNIGRDFTVEVVARGANGQVGKEKRITVRNPAPAAPVVNVQAGFTSMRVAFTPPDDIDFVGFDWFFVAGTGSPYAATPERINGNSVVREGLTSGTTYTVGVRSVDEFGAGTNATPVQITLPKINAVNDIDGLGSWATRIDPADLAFIAANVANDAVASEKIASLVAGKIAAGAIAVQVDVGEDSNRVLLDGENGIVQTVNSGYTALMGAHNVPAESSNPLIFSANDGANYSFWVDAAGNIKGRDFELNDGTINDFTAQNMLIESGSRFTTQALTTITVSDNFADFDNLQDAVDYAYSFYAGSLSQRIVIEVGGASNIALKITHGDYSHILVQFNSAEITVASLGAADFVWDFENCHAPEFKFVNATTLATVNVLQNGKGFLRMFGARARISANDTVGFDIPLRIVATNARHIELIGSEFLGPLISVVAPILQLRRDVSANESNPCFTIRQGSDFYSTISFSQSSGSANIISSDSTVHGAVLNNLSHSVNLLSGGGRIVASMGALGSGFVAAGTSLEGNFATNSRPAFIPINPSFQNAALYTGTAHDLTDYPIGSIVSVYSTSVIARNAARPIQRTDDLGANASFRTTANQSDPNTLSGIWRARGSSGTLDDDGTLIYFSYIFQKVAN